MSILIKNMDMPENCDKCRFQSKLRFCDAMPYNFCERTDDIGRSDWCPLIELPEKHGRLIDVDALKKTLIEEYVFYGFRELLNDFMEALDDAPTVIEAEDGT